MNEPVRPNKYTLWFWILSAVTALLRLAVVGRIGLSGDEAHYWTYSRYLDLSYFDHPPAIGYIIKFFTLIFGNTEFAVRLPAVGFFVLTSWLVFVLARRLFDDRTAFWSAALLNAMPVFSFLGAVMSVPDAPLAACWMAFIYFFYVAVYRDRPAAWYGAGLVLGLGMLSKYNAVLLVPSALVFMAFAPRGRKWFFRKEPYLALLIAGVVFLPVILWNLQNNWASFGFQLQHGFGKTAPHFSAALLGRCLGAQAGYLSPLLFIMFWVVLVVLIARAVRRDERSLFLVSFSAPTLFLFNGIACFNEILPHWPATGYLVLAIGATAYTLEQWHRRWFRGLIYAAWGLAILLNLLVPLQAVFKVLPAEWFLPKAEATRLEDGITRAEKVDITNELYGWPEVGTWINEILAAAPEPKPFIFTHRHYIASQLSFYIPGHPRVYCLSDRVDAYDFWQRDLSALDGRDGIFVTNDYFYVQPQKIFPFDSWYRTEQVDIHRAGRKIRIFWITEGRKFELKRLDPKFTSAAIGPKRTIADGIRQADYALFWLINRDLHYPPLDRAMNALTTVDVGLGVNTGLLAMMAVVGVLLWLFKRENFWKEFLLAVGIIFVGGVLVHIIKDIVGRVRPLSLFAGRVTVFRELLYNGSFPSGHSQIAFSVATYLTSRFRKYGWLFFLVATLVALSRVYIGVHFPVDIIAGAVIGTVTTALILKFVKIK
jgi:membrane-associated phospholipid phosphatase